MHTVIPAAAAPMRVPGQIGGEQEASVGGLAPGTLARVSQAVITGQALAAEWRTLLRALQGTPTPTPPAARCIPLSAGALMPLTEGILGAGMAVAMLLTERAEGRHQHQQGPVGPAVPAVGPALAQVAGGAGRAPAAALVCQAAQAGGVGGTGR